MDVRFGATSTGAEASAVPGDPDQRVPTGHDRAAAVERDPAAAPEPRWRFWPVLALVGTGVLLYGFYLYSQTRPPIRFGYFSHPPLYGHFRPVLDPLIWWSVPAALLLATVAWVVTSARRLPAWVALALVVAAGVATAAAVALVRGDETHLWRGIDPNSPFYSADLDLLDRYGVRGFVEKHPDLVRVFSSYNSKTHPPGVHVLLYGVIRLFGSDHALRATTALAALALAAAGAAWLMGRTLGGPRAGRISAVLLVAAPGPLLLAYTNMDAIFATAMATAAALFVLAVHRNSAGVAAGAGAVLALATLMTYATAFVALAATIAVLIQSGTLRTAAKLLGAAAAGGLAVLVVAHLAFGFDLWGSYRASPSAGRAYDPYWALASPAAWLIWAGLPLAALGVAGLFLTVPGARRPVLPLVLVLLMVGWATLPPDLQKLRPGEVERTWAFLYPMLAAAAGPVVDRWTRDAGRARGAVVAGLVLLSVAQTVLLQALWDNLS